MVSPIAPDHELHKRRFGRNMGLGLVLLAFVALVFGLTIVKVMHQSDPAVKAAMSSEAEP